MARNNNNQESLQPFEHDSYSVHSGVRGATWWMLVWNVVQLTAYAVFLVSALSLTLAAEQDQSKDVDNESGHADVDHTVHVLDVVWVCQSLDRLDEDREAESDEEHGVDQCTQHLSTSPTECVLARGFLRHLTTHTEYTTLQQTFDKWDMIYASLTSGHTLTETTYTSLV